jgi:Bacterial SH3 domain.
MIKRGIVAALCSIGIWSVGAAAGIKDGSIQLRVMAQSAPVRSGPGGSFREIGRVGHGQVFQALDRTADGSWYRIRISRERSGWVLAELVWPFEIVEESAVTSASSWFDRYILTADQLDDGKVTLALSGGALDALGEFTVRVGYQPSAHYLIELSCSQANGRFGSLLLFGGELVVPIGPWRSIVPFVLVGGGGAAVWPNQQSTLFKSGTSFQASAGGGVFIGLKGPIILRLDAQEVLLFGPDQLNGLLLLQGGLMVTF